MERDTRSPRALATWAAAGAGLVIGLLTALVMMPLNQTISAWAAWAVQGPPAGWLEVQERWITLQRVRAVLSTLGFGFLILSTQLRGEPGG